MGGKTARFKKLIQSPLGSPPNIHAHSVMRAILCVSDSIRPLCIWYTVPKGVSEDGSRRINNVKRNTDTEFCVSAWRIMD